MRIDVRPRILADIRQRLLHYMVGSYRGLFAELFWAGGAGDIPSDSNVGGDVSRLFHKIAYIVIIGVR